VFLINAITKGDLLESLLFAFDVAVLDYAQQYELVGKLQHYRKIDEIPFDFLRRRMSVIVRNGGRNLLVCKGAIEEVLSLCNSADDNGAAPAGVVPLTDEMRQEVRQFTHDLNEDGLRAVAVAYKWLPAEERTYTVGDEQDLVHSSIHQKKRHAKPSERSQATASPSRSSLATTRS